MDPYSEYSRQLEYYQYVDNQKKKAIDLTQGMDQDDAVKLLAEALFSKKDLTGILLDEGMEIVDLFCMLIELVLYGLQILTNGQADIFVLSDSTDEMISKLNTHLNAAGLSMEVHEDFFDDNLNLYRDKDDYYCQITQKPPPFLCYPGWYILNYRLIENKKYSFDRSTPLKEFRAFFISNNKKIFMINFNYLRRRVSGIAI